MVHEPDGNGWLPIHEAARSGNVEIIKILLDHGADINARTDFGEGHSTLNIALGYHDPSSEIVEFFAGRGARALSPGDEL
jgi:prolyl 4-hydroxylase